MIDRLVAINSVCGDAIMSEAMKQWNSGSVQIVLA